MAHKTAEEIRASFKKTETASEIKVSFDEIENFGNMDSLKRMVESINSYNTMLSEKIVFINDAMSASIPFTKENLYLMCAMSGSGKSTVAANITFPLWKMGKKVLVISNEESEQDVLFRIGCLDTGLNFNDYKKGKMDRADQLRVMALFPEISKYVKVLDISWREGLTTKVEGIKAALESVKKQPDYSCVLIDYFQLIKYSLKDPKKTSYDNLNDLRIWLGQYIKSSTMPIVLFAQLYSMGKKGGAKDIDARIKDCSAIVEPATVIIEVVPNHDAKTSDFIIVKDRFGLQGNKISCGFENGRFISLSDDEIIERQKNSKLRAQEEKLKKLNMEINVDANK